VGKWFQYVVQCSDGSFYAGVTTDLSRRVDEHNTSTRGAKYTRPRRPVRLVYFDDYEDRSSAQKAEARFKKLNRKQKNDIISERLLGLIK
jgi:putative endonuclease